MGHQAASDSAYLIGRGCLDETSPKAGTAMPRAFVLSVVRLVAETGCKSVAALSQVMIQISVAPAAICGCRHCRASKALRQERSGPHAALYTDTAASIAKGTSGLWGSGIVAVAVLHEIHQLLKRLVKQAHMASPALVLYRR